MIGFGLSRISSPSPIEKIEFWWDADVKVRRDEVEGSEVLSHAMLTTHETKPHGWSNYCYKLIINLQGVSPSY
jgi:hypothetical protein